MRARVLVGMVGMVAWATGGLTHAVAQQTNSPLYQPGAVVALPSWPVWQGAQDGRAVLAPRPYIPTGRYPTESRNPVLDNRAPTLWPAAPDLRDTTPRLGPPLENGAAGIGVRR
jgi:hypothetical protein